MFPDLKALEARALALPVGQRAELASGLLGSLDCSDDPVAVGSAWIEEADRRHRKHLGGGAEFLSAADALADVRAEGRGWAPMELERIATGAFGSTASQRRHLAHRLLASLEEQDGDVDAEAVGRAWIDEAERRYARFLTGEMEAVPLEEALARIRARPRRA